jgi:hypothetical protein
MRCEKELSHGLPEWDLGGQGVIAFVAKRKLASCVSAQTNGAIVPCRSVLVGRAAGG